MAAAITPAGPCVPCTAVESASAARRGVPGPRRGHARMRRGRRETAGGPCRARGCAQPSRESFWCAHRRSPGQRPLLTATMLVAPSVPPLLGHFEGGWALPTLRSPAQRERGRAGSVQGLWAACCPARPAYERGRPPSLFVRCSESQFAPDLALKLRRQALVRVTRDCLGSRSRASSRADAGAHELSNRL